MRPLILLLASFLLNGCQGNYSGKGTLTVSCTGKDGQIAFYAKGVTAVTQRDASTHIRIDQDVDVCLFKEDYNCTVVHP